MAQQIAKYRIVERIAAGGMGELFRARATGPGGFERDVALKVIREDLAASPMFKAQFLEEGKIAARLQHGNIVHVYDFGEDEGRLFICMELVDGLSLAALMKRCQSERHPLEARYAAYIAEQVAQGLDYAHRLEAGGRSQQLVHRDVTPANILLSYGGAVKLTDFGVARIRRDEPLTVGGVRKGTLRYMAPEQLTNAPDPRSDIFSLGAVLWELLTGQPLFEGRSDDEVVEQVRNRPIPAPSSYLPEIPAALDAVVLKALKRSPSERYQTARDFALDVGAFALTPRVDAFELGRELRRLFPEPPPKPPEAATLPGLPERPKVPIESPTDPDVRLPEPTIPAFTSPSLLPRTDPETPAHPSPSPVPRSEATTAAFQSPSSLQGRARGEGTIRNALILAAIPAVIALAILTLMPAAPKPALPSTPLPAPAPVVADTPPPPAKAAPPPVIAAPAPDPPPTTPTESSPARPEKKKPSSPPRAHRALKPGTLAVIAVHPWVQVFVDGVAHGYSPAPAISLAPGRHKVILSNDEVGVSQSLSIMIPEAGRVRAPRRTLNARAFDGEAASGDALRGGAGTARGFPLAFLERTLRV